MKIIGTTYEQFMKSTLNALGPIVGNWDIRDAKVRKFLTRQLFPEQNIGENEHRLHELFQAEEDKPTPVVEKPNAANIVILERYESGEHGNYLESVDTYVCMTTEATNNKLKDLFQNYYSEHADGSKILDAHMVEEKIESLCWDEDGEYDEALQKMNQEVSEFDTNEACEWLLENFEIDELITDAFFGDFLNFDLYKIRYEHSEIIY